MSAASAESEDINPMNLKIGEYAKIRTTALALSKDGSGPQNEEVEGYVVGDDEEVVYLLADKGVWHIVPKAQIVSVTAIEDCGPSVHTEWVGKYSKFLPTEWTGCPGEDQVFLDALGHSVAWGTVLVQLYAWRVGVLHR